MGVGRLMLGLRVCGGGIDRVDHLVGGQEPEGQRCVLVVGRSLLRPSKTADVAGRLGERAHGVWREWQTYHPLRWKEPVAGGS